MQKRWDIFCTVVDNFGDIGVSWRLARQLATEHGLRVRLWVDDLTIFACIVPDIDPSAAQQCLQGIEICHWQQPYAQVEPAEVVIEAFAVTLPDNYITAMTQLPQQPVWINLEYLSAENWVVNYHGLPSPHPRFPLVKYFFFPGFVADTGGLLRTQDLLSTCKLFDDAAQSEFWQRLGLPARRAGELRISLFCYDCVPLEELFAAWSRSVVPIYVLVPNDSVMQQQITAYFGSELCSAGEVLQWGQLTVQQIPFLQQMVYDQLLWACDVNFVRGEDSFVRAQWAARPFVWQIYPQSADAHWPKLDAFLNLYTENMPPQMATVVRLFWYSCNGDGLINETWPAFVASQTALKQHGEKWAEQLSCQDDLVSNLVRFARNQI